MRRSILLVALTTLLSLSTPELAAEKPVWFWSATCSGPAMGVEVSLDGVTLLKVALPLCRADRESVHSQGQQTARIEFSFVPTRPIVWEGYRDPPIKSKTGQLLEGDIWQAGADPDDLILGVSFLDSHLIYMNTVHVAHPTQRDETEIEPGLTLSTYPFTSGSEKRP